MSAVIMYFQGTNIVQAYGKTDVTPSAKNIYCVLIVYKYEGHLELISVGWVLLFFSPLPPVETLGTYISYLTG